MIHVSLHWGESTQSVLARDALDSWLEDMDGPDGPQAEARIRHLGPKAIPLLLSRVRQDDSLSTTMMYVLSLFGRDGLPELVQALTDPQESVRIAAVGTFMFLGPGGNEALPALSEMLTDQSGVVRFTTLLALRAAGPRRAEAVPALIRSLQQNPPDESSETIAALQTHILLLLGKIGPQATAAIPQLKSMLTHPSAVSRQEAALALWHITHDPELVVPTLYQMLNESDPQTQYLARTALIRIDREGPAAELVSKQSKVERDEETAQAHERSGAACGKARRW